MANLLNRITVNPEQCGGRACIRGMRIRVIDVLDLLAAGLSREEILAELPDLEADDITAALQYASRRLDYPILAACSTRSAAPPLDGAAATVDLQRRCSVSSEDGLP